MKNIFFLKVVLLSLLFSIALSYGLRVLAQQTFGSSATVGENQNTNVNATNGLGTTSVVQEHFLREMRVTIRQEEQSYSRMQEGSAQVLENPSGSVWSAGEMVGGLFKSGAYAKTPSVLFRLWQRPNPAATKTYKPEFRGVVEFFGEGGGEKKDPYAWNVINADYEIKDIEIHRSVAGGPFVKISDVQNVEPVIVGQKITLKVVFNTNITGQLSYNWNINGGSPIKEYVLATRKAEVILLGNSEVNSSQITYYHSNKGQVNITFSVTKDGDIGTVTKYVTFEVIKPICTSFTAIPTTLSPQAGVHDGATSVDLGDHYDIAKNPNAKGMRFQSEVSSPNGGAGHIGYIQLIASNRENYYSNGDLRRLTSNSQFVLDFISDNSSMDNCVMKTKPIEANSTLSNSDFSDTPHNPIMLRSRLPGGDSSMRTFVTESFQTIVVYKPMGGIWIPLKKISWSWRGAGHMNDAFESVDEGLGHVGGPSAPSDIDNLPTWNDNIQWLSEHPVWTP